MTTLTATEAALHRRRVFWRIHFWSALIASPFILIACVTGLLYVFTPQIERALHGHLDQVVPQESRRPLDQQLAAAREVTPSGWMLHSVVPAFDREDSTRVVFVPPPQAAGQRPTGAGQGGHGGHGGHGGQTAQAEPQFLRPNFGIPTRAWVAYVNPYTAEVIGGLAESDRFATWARKLHSSLLQGDSWRWMIELAASWTLVMLMTGVYLWWPQREQASRTTTPLKGRLAWRRWHAWMGVGLGLVSIVIVATGLTWSQYAGGQVKWLRDVTGQAPPRIPASLKSTPVDGMKPLSWEAALAAGQREAPQVSLMMMAPKGADGVWRLNQMDRGDPTKRFDLLLDAYSGARLYYSGWDQQTAFGKATAIGIPFHRGEFGLWNQAVLFVFGIGVLFSLVSGWVMVWMRVRRGGRLLPEVPPGAWRRLGPVSWAGALMALVAMPVLAVSALLVVVAEAWLGLRARQRAVG